MKCNQCNTEFEGKFCPDCGTAATSTMQEQSVQNAKTDNKGKKNKKVKKPFYKRAWFILLVAIIVIAVIASITESIKGKGEKISWNDIVMGDVIPEPSSKAADIYANSDESLSMFIYGIKNSDYSDYVKKCEDMGFSVDVEKDTDSFEAYNTEGYKLSLRFMDYRDTYMDIDLDAPVKMSEIQWPTSTIGKLLPVPKSTVGKFSYEHDNSFFVYIGESSELDFIEYVTACSDNGFTVDYSKGEGYYYADNSDGYHVSLKYEGNNTMSISIDAPDDVEETTASDTTANEKEEGTSNEKTETTSNSENNEELVDGMHKDFKEAMDNYEKFMDEYVAFMKKYSESDGTDASLLSDYSSYMIKYGEAMDSFSKWESEDMNSKETAYYIEVQTRVSKKLLEAAQ